MPIKAISRRLGVSRNAVRRGVGGDGTAEVLPAAATVGGGRVRACDPGVVGGVSVDAGVGDRRSGRLEQIV